MKGNSTFSSREMDELTDQLERLMVQLKQQSTSDREEIQAAFPTLSRHRLDTILAEAPLTPDEMISRIKQLVQYLIGKKY